MAFERIFIKPCSDSRMVLTRGENLEGFIVGLRAIGIDVSRKVEVTHGHNAGNEPLPLPEEEHDLVINLSHHNPLCGATGVTHHEGDILDALENALFLKRKDVENYIKSKGWQWNEVFRDVSLDHGERARNHGRKLEGNSYLSGHVNLEKGIVQIVDASTDLKQSVGKTFTVPGQAFKPGENETYLKGQNPKTLVLHAVGTNLQGKLTEKPGEEFPVEIEFNEDGTAKNPRAVASIAYWLFNELKQHESTTGLRIKVIPNAKARQFKKLFQEDGFFARLREKIAMDGLY